MSSRQTFEGRLFPQQVEPHDPGRAVNPSNDLIIESIAAPTQDVTDLLTELDGVLAAEYTPEQRHALPLDAIFKPHIRFFLARIDGVATGCGGVAFYHDFAELKRMYVRPAARGRGVAQAILTRVEAASRHAGHTVLRLETGERQVEAMRLYARAGFHQCAPFGDYAAMAPSAISTSVFFEKQLS